MTEKQMQVDLRISTRDVGSTQVATFWVNGDRAYEWYTSTRHPSKSLLLAQESVATALGVLVAQRVGDEIYARPWLGEPGGFHETD